MQTLPSLAVLFAAAVAHAGTVELHIANVEAKGALYAQLCTETEFMTKGCALHTRVEPHAGETTIRFTNVAPGRYAASVFQDTNGNGKLDFGMMGAPIEPWGASRDAKAVMGPPAFKDAVVEISAAPALIPLHLVK